MLTWDLLRIRGEWVPVSFGSAPLLYVMLSSIWEGASNKQASSILGSTFGTVEAAKMYCQLPTSGNFNIQSIQSPLLNTEAPRWHCRIFFHSAALSANWKEIGSYRFFFRLFVWFFTRQRGKTRRKGKEKQTKPCSTQTSVHIISDLFRFTTWNQGRKLSDSYPICSS